MAEIKITRNKLSTNHKIILLSAAIVIPLVALTVKNTSDIRYLAQAVDAHNESFKIILDGQKGK